MPSSSWVIVPPDPARRDHLVDELGIHPITAQALINRGITLSHEANSFLTPSLAGFPDPFLLPDMDRAVRRIIAALTSGERIALYGDYDVDGVTSTALLARFLQSLHHQPLLFLPHRTRDGYGLSQRGIESLKKDGAKLIITVDNGIGAEKEIRFARSQGIDVIVTDHHEVLHLPQDASAILNPKRAGTPEPFTHLCGCGVAFCLAAALRKSLREEGLLPHNEPNLKALLDLVAVGTIADSVPLIGINRMLTSIGLDVLRHSQNHGLCALMHVAHLPPEKVQTRSVAFALAPRLNAAGRLEHAASALDLLLTDDQEHAQAIALKLDALNSERQRIQDSVLVEATAQIATMDIKGAIVVYQPHWNLGVLGIVASKLVERFKCPAIVLGHDGEKVKGSVRSLPALNILECLHTCHDTLQHFGGHAQAAGVALDVDNIDPFRKRLSAICQEKLTSPSLDNMRIDAEVHPREINDQLISELERFEPCGIGNPEPLFCTHNIAIADQRIVGKNHLKFRAVSDMSSVDAIGFNLAHQIQEDTSPWSIAFRPQFNTWNGIKRIQLNIKDLKNFPPKNVP